jgi:hypothetical protein
MIQFRKLIATFASTWLLTLCFLLPAAAQSPQQSSPSSQAPPAGASSTAEEQEHKITPQEAEELFRTVDEILEFASKDTGLPIKTPVKRKLATRDEVVRYIERRMKEDPDVERIDRAERTLEKLGLLPKGFELRKFLVGMMREQVAGYYDPQTKTVYMLDWVTAETQKPVLAHELTHALQDQSYNLEKWAQINEKKLSPQEEIARDEARTARQAVDEGQAMVVLFDYMLAPAGRSVADSPELVESMRSQMAMDNSSPIVASAPLYLREGLLFPYVEGLDLVRKVYAANGKRAAFDGLLSKPPVDTRQVMDPDVYLRGEKMPEVKIADLGGILGKGWERYDYGGFGAFDLYVMTKQWGGDAPAKTLPAQLRGGYYLSFQQKTKPSGLCVAMILGWSDAASARAFDRVYRDGLPARYNKISGTETEDGPVVSEVIGSMWVATEGFDEATAAKLRAAMLKEANGSQAATIH